MLRWKKQHSLWYQNRLTGIIIAGLKFYRNHLSTLTLGCCRFHPSCSEYMKQAIKTKGILAGLGLGMRRLLRCNQFHAGGYDPVE
ncbi:MAG: membrane protein insertion efficiency factor YidD [Candidatus Omnitrophica bacterium]|nr:membrane protein insertion efficiency factor YidD [Candidatus Omnitrophota bacterium]MBU1925347.1 membrane protein insertion efficiency factor YidD [Candidatus Omnitrophota bacterium]